MFRISGGSPARQADIACKSGGLSLCRRESGMHFRPFAPSLTHAGRRPEAIHCSSPCTCTTAVTRLACGGAAFPDARPPRHLSILAHAIALTSPLDASRCSAVSPAFRAAADSNHVWHRFLLKELQSLAAKTGKKEAYLGLCDAANAVPVEEDDGGCSRVWLERATGAKCYALSAKKLSLPWDDGEFSWKWTTHPCSRFSVVAELVDCTCLDIYGRLPSAALTPATTYAAYLVYGTTDGHHLRLSYPDQETAVPMGSRVVARHAVCLRPDDAEARKFKGAALQQCSQGEESRRPRLREDGWWEMEMGQLHMAGEDEIVVAGEEVVASFEVLGWYPKRGLIVEGMEFRPVQ